jgi:chromosome segregation ATPase
MFREITRLRDVHDMKTKESLNQHDRMKALEYDLQRTLIRIEDQNKGVETRSFEIRQRGQHLNDVEKEIARLRDINGQQSHEIIALRRDVDRIAADCYDLRKNIENTEARNIDLSGKIRSVDIRSKEKEDDLYAVRKDIEN